MQTVAHVEQQGLEFHSPASPFTEPAEVLAIDSCKTTTSTRALSAGSGTCLADCRLSPGPPRVETWEGVNSSLVPANRPTFHGMSAKSKVGQKELEPMTALSLAAAVVIWLLLASSAFAGPEGALPGVGVPSLPTSSPADDLFATAELSTLLDPAPGATQHYGPFPSTSPDSGTCGNDWATDTFDRHFTVKLNHDGTFTVIEQFKNGSFVTIPGLSPGSCDITDGSPPGTVATGVSGSMHGYFIIPAGTMQTSTDPSCVAGMPLMPCTTTGFVNSHFTPCYPAICPVTTFFFHYSAGDQMLVEHEWKNASSDRGGNHGDIRSVNVP